METSAPSPWQRAWPILLFLATTFAFTGPALLDGDTLAGTDIYRFHVSPYREDVGTLAQAGNTLQSDQAEQLPLVAEFWASVRQGEIQRWEPDLAGGVPLLTGAYNRVLAPPYLTFLVLPPHLAPTAAVALGLLVAQLGTYALARRLGLSRGAAALAGVAYGFSGPVTGLLHRVHEALFLPALLATIHGAMTSRSTSRRGRDLALSAVLVACVWFSGFPAAGLFVLYTAAAWTVYLAVAPSAVPAAPAVTARLGRAALVGVATVAGTALSAFQLLPTLEFLARSESLERSYALTHAAGLSRLATAVSGRFFGAFQDKDWWFPDPGYANPVEASSTMGAVVLVLLGAVVVVRRRRASPIAEAHVSRFLLPLGAVVLGGVYVGGPFLWAVHLLPYMSSNSFGRARFILALVVALVAALGVDRLRAPRTTDRAPATTAVITGVVVAAVLVGVWRSLDAAVDADALAAVGRDLIVPGIALLLGAIVLVVGTQVRRRGRTLPSLALGLPLAMVLAGELMWGAWGWVPASEGAAFYPDHRAFDAIEEETGPGGPYRFVARELNTLRASAAALLDISDVRVNYPALDRYRQLLRAADPGVFRTSRLRVIFSSALDPTGPILDRVSARYLVAPLTDPIVAPGRTVRVDADPTATPASLPSGIADGAPVRGLRFEVTERPRCREGWVELLAGSETVSRVRVQDVRTEVLLPIPDRPVHPGTWRVEATDCPLGLDLVEAILPGGLELVSTEGWAVYRRPDARPRLELARQVAVEPDADDRLARLADPGAPAGVVLEAGTPIALDGGTARFVRDTPDVVEVEVDSRGRGLLVLRDVAAPGWTARVDGSPAEIVTVDHAFRGVWVPPGESRVTFAYAPTTFVVGRALSAAGAVVTVTLLLVGRRRPGRTPSASRPPGKAPRH